MTVNAVINVDVLPLSSSVWNATITESPVPGTNLNDEKPSVALKFPNWK